MIPANSITDAGSPSFAGVADFLFSPPVIMGLFFIALVFFGAMTLVFLHHWRAYSVDEHKVKHAMRAYIIGGCVIMLLMFITGVLGMK